MSAAMWLFWGWLWRGALLGIVAAGCAAALKNARASHRHALWCLTLFLLALAPALPKLPLPVPVPPPQRLPSKAESPIGIDRPETDAVTQATGISPAIATAPKVAVPEAAPMPARTDDVQRNEENAVTRLGFAVWLVGALVFLCRLALDLRIARRYRRGLRPFPLPDSLARQFDAVTVLSSDSLSTPIALGVVRPVIALPGDAARWPDDRLRVALLHEAAHVARRDPLRLVLARTVAAVCWLHPVAHLALAKLIAEAERACDEAVLEKIDAPDYAAHLLEIVAMNRTRQNAAPKLSSPLVKTSRLETRIRAILRPTTRSTRPEPAALACAALLAATILQPFARAQNPAARNPGKPLAPQTRMVPQKFAGLRFQAEFLLAVAQSHTKAGIPSGRLLERAWDRAFAAQREYIDALRDAGQVEAERDARDRLAQMPRERKLSEEQGARRRSHVLRQEANRERIRQLGPNAAILPVWDVVRLGEATLQFESMPLAMDSFSRSSGPSPRTNPTAREAFLRQQLQGSQQALTLEQKRLALLERNTARLSPLNTPDKNLRRLYEETVRMLYDCQIKIAELRVRQQRIGIAILEAKLHRDPNPAPDSRRLVHRLLSDRFLLEQTRRNLEQKIFHHEARVLAILEEHVRKQNRTPPKPTVARSGA